MSHIEYSNSTLSGLPDCTINQMQCIQNYGAKLVLGKTKHDSNTASLGDALNYLKNLLIRFPVTNKLSDLVTLHTT